MLDQFLTKVVEQSLDEIEFKNICLTVPLSPTKFEKILKSNFGDKLVVIDLSITKAVLDFVSIITDLDNEASVLIKNINHGNEDITEQLTFLLSRRQLYVLIDEPNIQKEAYIDVAKFDFLTIENDELIREPLKSYFNIVFNFTGKELPDPIKLSNVEFTNRNNNGLNADRNSDVFTVDQIYEWQNNRRTPDLSEDLAIIQSVIESGDINSEPFQSDMVSICRAYVNYLLTFYGHHEDKERDILAPLKENEGVYRRFLYLIFNANNGTNLKEEEFIDNGDSIDADMLPPFVSEHFNTEEKAEFLYRYLMLFKETYQDSASFSLDEVNQFLEIPENFEKNFQSILSNLFEEVAYKLANSNQTDYNESLFDDNGVTKMTNPDTTNTNLVWHIDDAVFEFDNAEDLKSWVDNGQQIQFEFDPTTSDDGGGAIFEDPDSGVVFFDLDSKNSELKIKVNKKNIVVSAWVNFSVNLKEDISQDEFEEWASENGGISCGTINLKDIDATITSDDGQELRWNN